jgi:hypothetical protein
LTRLVLQCFSVTDTTANLETSFAKDSNSDGNLQVQLKNVLVSMEAKRTDFDHIRQHVNKVKKYASDLQTFIGVSEMTSVVDGEVQKQKGHSIITFMN